MGDILQLLRKRPNTTAMKGNLMMKLITLACHATEHFDFENFSILDKGDHRKQKFRKIVEISKMWYFESDPNHFAPVYAPIVTDWS